MREQVTRVRAGAARALRRGRDDAEQPHEHAAAGKHCVLDDAGKRLLQQAMDDLGLSARVHDRILRVARTIADLEGSDGIRTEHVIEAIGYRSLDRKLWAK